MNKYFRSGDSKTIHIVIPGSWKHFLEGRAKQNGRSLSNEVRDTIQRAYKLSDHEQQRELIVPEGLRELRQEDLGNG